MPLERVITDPVCICAENAIYFHCKSQAPPVRVYVADYEFWQDAVTML